MALVRSLAQQQLGQAQVRGDQYPNMGVTRRWPWPGCTARPGLSIVYPLPTFVGELGTDVLPLLPRPGVGGTIDLSVSGALGFLSR